MKKLLIVEDEKMIRQGIKAIALRSPISIDEIIECKNGEEAYEIIRNQKIDMMITDIRMPKKDGITLVKEIQTLPHIPKIVVISGYDDFSYAVDLLRYGAKEYILKPIERERIFNILVKMEKEILEEELKQSEYDRVLYRQLKYLLFNEVTDSSEVNGLENKFEDYFLQGEYVVCCTNFKNCEEEENHQFIYIEEVEGQCVYILKTKDQDKQVEKLLKNHFVGISRKHSSVYELGEAYQEALYARKHAFATGVAVKEYSEMIEKKEVVSNQLIQQLVHMLGTDKIEQVNKYLGKVLFQTKQGEMEPDEFGTTMSALVEGICNNYKNILDLSDKKIGTLKNIYCFDNAQRYYEEIVSWINEINDSITNEFDDYKNKQKIQKAIQYIQENYNKDLNMAVVSNHISMNYSLFSHEFKQYAEMNFVSYLKTIRINQAKKLLEETDMKIIELSVCVGYENEKHFMKTFKSVCGVSPSEYRKNVQIGKK